MRTLEPRSRRLLTSKIIHVYRMCNDIRSDRECENRPMNLRSRSEHVNFPFSTSCVRPMAYYVCLYSLGSLRGRLCPARRSLHVGVAVARMCTAHSAHARPDSPTHGTLVITVHTTPRRIMTRILSHNTPWPQEDAQTLPSLRLCRAHGFVSSGTHRPRVPTAARFHGARPSAVSPRIAWDAGRFTRGC